jgi:hypothetical protein
MNDPSISVRLRHSLNERRNVTGLIERPQTLR